MLYPIGVQDYGTIIENGYTYKRELFNGLKIDELEIVLEKTSDYQS